VSADHNCSLPLCYKHCDGWTREGRVTSVGRSSLHVHIAGVTAGSVIAIETNAARRLAEVRSVRDQDAACTPLEETTDIVVGDRATSVRAILGCYCGESMLGQCVDAWGRGGRDDRASVTAPHLRPLPIDERRPIVRSLKTGIAAIDALCTIGVGQRVALFSGAGVGKSTLLRQIAEQADVEAHVFALIGERGREAAETVASLRESVSWPRTTVVCATAECPPRERFAAVRSAMAQAEWLCQHGHDVLLTIDSLTRVANAWRELALESGEPAAHRGHPASMIGTLAGIVERAGARGYGSITGIYAVLVDGDDPFEPVTDAVRGLLDGHIVLSRSLADAGHFPPIDVLRSASRLLGKLASREQLADGALVRRALSALERAEDLFAIGAYRPGGDAWLDAAVAQRDRLERWIFHGAPSTADPIAELARIAAALRAAQI
jgi:flagellum-specific ATP synthase